MAVTHVKYEQGKVTMFNPTSVVCFSAYNNLKTMPIQNQKMLILLKNSLE